MKIDEFTALGPHEAQAALSQMAYAARAPFIDAYKQQRDIALTHSQVQYDSAPANIGGFGWFLIAIGAIGAFLAFFFNVGVETHSGGLYGAPEKIANIDMIAIRHMLLASALTVFLAGWLLVAAEHVADRFVEPNGQIPLMIFKAVHTGRLFSCLRGDP